MPVVRIEMYDGRSMDQKRQLVKEITDVVARVTGNTPEGVHVIIDEVKRLLTIEMERRQAIGASPAAAG